MVLMSILLWVHLIAFSKGHVNEHVWPVLVYEKGTQANIPCMIKGEANAYFWKKGATYQTSEHVAANVHGAPDMFANATHGKLTVSDDGTLIINDISLEDDDTYFCRVISEQIEHYTSVTVYSQVSLHSFSLSIDQCPSLLGCTLHFKPGSRHKLTCTASFVSSLVDLKWTDVHDNGVTSLRTVTDNKDGSFNISVSTEVDYEKPSVLLCEANSPNMRGEVVTVELESTQETQDGPETIIVVLTVIVVVLIIVIVTLIGSFFIVKLKQPKTKKQKDYALVPSTQLTQKQEDLEGKDEIITQQKAVLESKNEIITQQKAELESKNEIITQQKAELESKNEQLEHQQEELESKDEQVQQQKEELKRKDKEITKQTKIADTYSKAIDEKTKEIVNYKKKLEEQEIIIIQKTSNLA